MILLILPLSSSLQLETTLKEKNEKRGILRKQERRDAPDTHTMHRLQRQENVTET